jgi:restriction endonuclease S subunit
LITTKPDVLPDYLAWYLAHPTTQRELASRMVGSSLPFVPLAAMRELEIEVPALETQKRIVRVQALHRRQADLEEQITHARTQYIDTITKAALERAAQPNP